MILPHASKATPISAVHFIQILSLFYPNIILILSWFFRNSFIKILSRFYPDQDKIWIKGHMDGPKQQNSCVKVSRDKGLLRKLTYINKSF